MAEVAEQEETKMCGTCERPIPMSKFRMHDIGCARNNYKCRECGDVVAKADKEEHEEQAHKPVKCQYCPYTAAAAKFGNHEEKCDMQPRPCQYCEQIFTIERWIDHQEACGTKTQKCEECSSYIQKKHWGDHKATNECQMMLQQNQQKEAREQQQRLEELEKFRKDEEIQRRKMQEKREAREREEENQRARQVREEESWRRMNQPVAERGPRAASGSKPKPAPGVSTRSQMGPTVQNLRQPGISGSAKPNKPVISNTRKPVARASRPQEVSHHVDSMSIAGSKPKPSGTGRTAMNSMNSQRLGAAGANVVGTRASGANKVTTGVARNPSAMMPAQKVSAARRPSPKAASRVNPAPNRPAQQNYGMMDEDAATAAAIAAALDEDEGLALAEKLQNEAYTGQQSARGGGGANQEFPGAGMEQQQMMDDGSSVRAARPQVMDQMIGGFEEPMAVDELSGGAMPDHFGAGARDNFPSGFQDSQWGRAAAAGGRDAGTSNLNMNGTTSQADLERAIAESMEVDLAAARGSHDDEDAQLAAILEASKHDR